MLRHNPDIESLIGGKIRKRGCSSSSSTPSVLQNYRFKRAVLVKKRGGSSTPWRTGSRSPSVVSISKSPRYAPSQGSGRWKPVPVSARKLAASLWGLNEIPSPGRKEEQKERRDFEKEMRWRDRIARSTRSGSLPPHLSDPSHSPTPERMMDRSGASSVRRRTGAISQKIRQSKQIHGGFDSVSNASLMEIEPHALSPTGSIIGPKNRLKDVGSSLTTSQELLKILDRIWSQEERHSSSISLISALHTELQRAHMLVEQLIQEQRSNRGDINQLTKQLAEEKSVWKSKQREKFNAAVQAMAGDFEAEKKLRRRTENLNLKLGKELAETKTALSNAIQELENEKRARERIDQACDGIAKGIGEDKAVVEALKRESIKIREEIEEDRELLQLMEIRKEERVQAKLSDAELPLKQKTAAVDRLKNKLEAFLKMKRPKETRGRQRDCEATGVEDKKAIHPRQTHVELDQNADDEMVENGAVVDSPAESDLQSIELNMDDYKKSYKWRHAMGTLREEGKRVSAEEEMRRKSMSEKLLRASNRGIEGGIEWEFGTENLPRRGSVLDQGRLSESSSVVGRRLEKKFQYGEAGRYESAMGLREHILSSSRIGFAQGSASPTRQWAQQLSLQDYKDPLHERSIKEMVRGTREFGLEARLTETKRHSKTLK
ncbi:hypothetical protein ACLOJK_023790 [Asimina triloba]